MATQTLSAPAFVLRGPRSGKSILSRWYETVSTSRQRQADQMIASYVAQMGGRFTDQIERNIESRVTGTSLSLGGAR